MPIGQKKLNRVASSVIRARSKPTATATAVRAVLLTVATLLLSGCGGDYEIALPNGYRLICTNAHSVQIFEPSSLEYRNSSTYEKRTIRDGSTVYHESIVVPPKIVAIGSTGEFVHGIVESSPHSESARLTVPGYFVLDTGGGEVVLGLDEQGFKVRLKKLGVTSTPSLSRDIRGFRCTDESPVKSPKQMPSKEDSGSGSLR